MYVDGERLMGSRIIDGVECRVWNVCMSTIMEFEDFAG